MQEGEEEWLWQSKGKFSAIIEEVNKLPFRIYFQKVGLRKEEEGIIASPNLEPGRTLKDEVVG